MLLELMVLLVPGGVILLYDGWRKGQKKEYFVHSPLSSWLLGLLPFCPPRSTSEGQGTDYSNPTRCLRQE